MTADKNLRVLIFEDEYLLASDLATELRGWGAQIVGYAARADKALQLAQSASLDANAAVVDINLCGEDIFPAIEALLGRGVAVVFCTGYRRSDIPKEFAAIPHVEKPASTSTLMAALCA